ncbi:MAG: GyrI-like domain-containing protein [Ardenticatenaceae bacterium]|nr:GyrI-like domain-containing protein [Anaerolineales bacterium]MCB8976433.1 GyrI-like domain-containing protein [Ardenticatenaceae bacterium]
MQKVDFKKELKHLYNPSAKETAVVEVPTMNFLTILGEGDPNTTQWYKDAVSALYAVAYTLKFMVKKGELAIDYGVMPLQGLWWAEDMRQFSTDDKSNWLWQMMIMQPDFITAEMVAEAKAQVLKKKGIAAVEQVNFERFAEGKAVQIMYFGPYANEGPTIQKLHEFIWTSGGQLSGKHHEIYLNDPSRTAPEKLKTIIRQPFVVKEAVVAP